MEEFESKEETHLRREQFLHSVKNIRYCKTETYGDCMFGTLSIPVKHHLLEEKQTFSFHVEMLRDNSKGTWRAAVMLKSVLTNKIIASLGFMSMTDYYLKICEN